MSFTILTNCLDELLEESEERSKILPVVRASALILITSDVVIAGLLMWIAYSEVASVSITKAGELLSWSIVNLPSISALSVANCNANVVPASPSVMATKVVPFPPPSGSDKSWGYELAIVLLV